MLLHEYITKLNQLVENNPDAKQYPVYFASDSEGNNITMNGFGPSIQFTDIESYYIDIQSKQDEEYHIPVIVLN